MPGIVVGLSVTSIVFCGAIFGFFYAWVRSTMWGLDQADPRVAIEAMQAMNASVRNAVFFPAFFLTPVVLGLTAAAMRFSGRKSPALWFAAATLVYLTSGLFLTLAVNVPMNEALAAIPVPKDIECARDLAGLFRAVAVLEPGANHRIRYRLGFCRLRSGEIVTGSAQRYSGVPRRRRLRLLSAAFVVHAVDIKAWGQPLGKATFEPA